MLTMLTTLMTGMTLGVAPVAPSIDERFDDWATPSASARDLEGDAQGPFDLTAVHASVFGDRLWLKLELAEPLNLQSGRERELSLMIVCTNHDDPEQQLMMNLRPKTVVINGGTPRAFQTIDYISAPTIASTAFEMAFDLDEIGIEEGGRVRVEFVGSDELSEPLSVRALAPAAEPAKLGSPDKPAGVLRVASLNTWRNGILDPERSRDLADLFDAMDADIVCLQEEWDTTEQDVLEWLDRADILDDNADWQLMKIGSNVVALPRDWTMLPVTLEDHRFTLALIDTGDQSLVVGSVHLKCCGYAGSREDRQRIDQSETMLEIMEEMRSGLLDAELKPYAEVPFLLIGDWNLVGSGGALEVFTERGHVDLEPRRLRPDRVATWRNIWSGAGGFPPGRLDLAVASSDLPVVNSFVFDTSDLDDDTLDRLDLEADSSEVSDHLMLVVDIRRPVSESE